MEFATREQLNRYYDLYKDVDVTFSKDVMQALCFNARQVCVRSAGGQCSCVMNSVSMVGAKVILSRKSSLLESIQVEGASVSIRFSFFESDARDAVSFFVTARVLGVEDYAQSTELVVLSVAYTQRIPDTLIERLGLLVEANISSKKRKSERIAVNKESMRRIGLMRAETIVFIQAIPRRCVLRDVSFGGAKFIMMGVAPFLKGKETVLKLDFEEPSTSMSIRGHVVRADQVEGRKDLVAVAMEYDFDVVPVAYRMCLNRYASDRCRRFPGTDEDCSAASAGDPGRSSAGAEGIDLSVPFSLS